MPPDSQNNRLNQPILQFARQDYVRIRADQTVDQALESVRQTPAAGRIVYFYVVDDEGRLQGVVPTRRLLLSPRDMPVSKIMERRVIAVPSSSTLLDACDLFLFHRLLALPVIDEERRMLGVVDVELYTDELSGLARQVEQDDVFQLIGVHVAALRQASPAVVFRNRFPWLLCNVAGGLACALIGGLYENVLNEVIALALFIPVVLALAESVSIQSLTLTLTLQGQNLRPVGWRGVLGSLSRETPIGVLLGISCGAIVALAAWAWQGHGLVALCLLLSILISITLATLFGLLVPTVLNAAQRDPKTASGPITLALTDLATLFCYLGLATLLLA